MQVGYPFTQRTTLSEMPIDLGLARISRLLSIIGNPHIRSYKSIHVAGTNGKGSTIAYVSSILNVAQVRHGRFTSPHLLDSNDCISINDEVYPSNKFKEIKSLVSSQNDRLALGCTEFELLTATAFKIFEIEKVELALIEVGLGGRLDATNVLEPSGVDQYGKRSGGVILAGITKIGMDHEQLLGNTIEAIAREKAGIIKQHIISVVDGSNEESVLMTVRARAKEMKSQLLITNPSEDQTIGELIKFSPLKGEYQIQNLAVALSLVRNLKEKFDYPGLTDDKIKEGIRQTVWPGRLQTISDDRTGITALIDGAHNENAAIELGKYLLSLRTQLAKNGFIFVVGLSKGKSIEQLLKHIVNKTSDTLLTASFTRPTDMPWVQCHLEKEIAEAAIPYLKDVRLLNSCSIKDVFDYLLGMRKEGDTREIVFCGSLYLCSDILRYIRHEVPQDRVEQN